MIFNPYTNLSNIALKKLSIKEKNFRVSIVDLVSNANYIHN